MLSGPFRRIVMIVRVTMMLVAVCPVLMRMGMSMMAFRERPFAAIRAALRLKWAGHIVHMRS